MTVNEVKTSNRLVITNISKMSNRLTMDRVTHVDPSDANDEGGEDVNMFPPLRAASSTRLRHLLLSYSSWSPEYEGGKDLKNWALSYADGFSGDV
jgi:hypothetical protein